MNKPHFNERSFDDLWEKYKKVVENYQVVQALISDGYEISWNISSGCRCLCCHSYFVVYEGEKIAENEDFGKVLAAVKKEYSK